MKIAVLFPGLQNHWIVAIPGETHTQEEAEELARVWFILNFTDDWEDLRVTGAQRGNPGAIRARLVSRDPDAASYDKPTTAYVAIAFDYLGKKDFIGWPELGNGKLYAIAQGAPTIHLKSTWETILDNIDRTVDDVEEDAAAAAAKGAELGGALMTGAFVVGGFLLLSKFLDRR